MTRKEALRFLEDGKTLVTVFTPENHGVSSDLEVWIRIEEICDFRRERQYEHTKFGPIHVRFWEAGPVHWIHITPEQLDNFLKRNYPA